MRLPFNPEQHISNVKKWQRKAGKNHYLRFLNGEKLTRDEAIQAKCYECVCGEDTEPCLVPTCPLTHFCQWNKPKKAKTSREDINSSDTVQDVLQNISDPVIAQAYITNRDQNQEVTS